MRLLVVPFFLDTDRGAEKNELKLATIAPVKPAILEI